MENFREEGLRLRNLEQEDSDVGGHLKFTPQIHIKPICSSLPLAIVLNG